MNQVVTLCESLVEIAPLLISDRECEVFKGRITRYLKVGPRAATPLHGDVGRLLGLARFWSEKLTRCNILDESEATLRKVLMIRRHLRGGMTLTLELAVLWFQAERRC